MSEEVREYIELKSNEDISIELKAPSSHPPIIHLVYNCLASLEFMVSAISLTFYSTIHASMPLIMLSGLEFLAIGAGCALSYFALSRLDYKKQTHALIAFCGAALLCFTTSIISLNLTFDHYNKPLSNMAFYSSLPKNEPDNTQSYTPTYNSPYSYEYDTVDANPYNSPYSSSYSNYNNGYSSSDYANNYNSYYSSPYSGSYSSGYNSYSPYSSGYTTPYYNYNHYTYPSYTYTYYSPYTYSYNYPYYNNAYSSSPSFSISYSYSYSYTYSNPYQHSVSYFYTYSSESSPYGSSYSTSTSTNYNNYSPYSQNSYSTNYWSSDVSSNENGSTYNSYNPETGSRYSSATYRSSDPEMYRAAAPMNFEGVDQNNNSLWRILLPIMIFVLKGLLFVALITQANLLKNMLKEKKQTVFNESVLRSEPQKI